MKTKWVMLLTFCFTLLVSQELIVECAVDINNHFILEIGSTIPSEYFQSFLDMASLDVISESLARALAPTAGLRNRLAHEYETVIDRIVYNAIHSIITNYARYINQIQEWLSAHEPPPLRILEVVLSFLSLIVPLLAQSAAPEDAHVPLAFALPALELLG